MGRGDSIKHAEIFNSPYPQTNRYGHLRHAHPRSTVNINFRHRTPKDYRFTRLTGDREKQTKNCTLTAPCLLADFQILLHESSQLILSKQCCTNNARLIQKTGRNYLRFGSNHWREFVQFFTNTTAQNNQIWPKQILHSG